MDPFVTVVIPTLDEEDSLGRLLGDLSLQRGVTLEVIVADASNGDGTRATFDRAKRAGGRKLKWLSTGRGRGRQQNAGARAASAGELLFLHADTRLYDPLLLAEAAKAMRSRRESLGHARLAGHFGLRFDSDEGGGFFRFYEAKTRTNRPHTINGDQGFWVGREFFEALGGFDESLPFMEDARFEAKVWRAGEWLLLPGVVTTSARRFLAEGRVARQLVNALIKNFDAIGRADFLSRAEAVYRENSSLEKMRLLPYLLAAHRATLEGGFSGWLSCWYRTGCFVRSNAWQLPFLLGHRKGGSLPKGLTSRFDRVFNLFTGNPVGGAVAAFVTMTAFYALLACALLKGNPKK